MEENQASASESNTQERDSNGGGATGDLKQKAHGVAEKARAAAASKKDDVVEGAKGVAESLHHVSESLRSDEQEELARYTDAVAEKIEQLAGGLKDRDLAALGQDVTRFAQRQPALFLGGAFTLGLLAARFLKSSSSSSGGALRGGSAFREAD